MSAEHPWRCAVLTADPVVVNVAVNRHYTSIVGGGYKPGTSTPTALVLLHVSSPKTLYQGDVCRGVWARVAMCGRDLGRIPSHRQRQTARESERRGWGRRGIAPAHVIGGVIFPAHVSGGVIFRRE